MNSLLHSLGFANGPGAGDDLGQQLQARLYATPYQALN